MSAVSPELVKSVRKAMPDAPLEKAAEVALMFKDAVSNPIDPNRVEPGLRAMLGIDAGGMALLTLDLPRWSSSFLALDPAP